MSVGSALLSARHIIAALNIPRGAHVADFATGRTGHFVFPLAESVGEAGCVYAIDILPSILAVLESVRAERALHQIQLVWGDIERRGGVHIPAATLDYAFFVHTFSSLADWEGAIAEVRRLMRPGGKVVLIDWDPKSGHILARMTPRATSPHELDRLFHGGGMPKYGEFSPSAWHWGRVYSS